MLAPLKDRSIIEPSHPHQALLTTPSCDEKMEIEDLRRALRDSRNRLRNSAWQSTRQLSLLNAEVSNLQVHCAKQEARLEHYASGVAIIQLGQELMRLAVNNERLKEGAQRVSWLEKMLQVAHGDYQQLAAERDALVRELAQVKGERWSDRCMGAGHG